MLVDRNYFFIVVIYDFYRDIAVVAYPAIRAEQRSMSEYELEISSDAEVENIQKVELAVSRYILDDEIIEVEGVYGHTSVILVYVDEDGRVAEPTP